MVFISLVLIWLAASWALFHPSFFRVHDYIHAARVGEMRQALSEGHFPVRWSGNFGYGYGMPLFEFYAPLPSYVGAGLYWLGIDIISTLKLLWMISSAGILLGGYWLGKKLVGRTGGVVLAALLTLAPYRAVNLYVRGALSEAWGMLFLPWILLAVLWVIERKRWGWLALSFAVAGVILSHNLTALIFLPLSAVFGLAFAVLKRPQALKPRVVVEGIGGYLLGAGLAAFYAIPALLEKDHTQISRILGGYFHYSQHFLYIRQLITPFWGYGGSQWGPDDGISFFLGWGMLLGLVVVAGVVVYQLLQLLKQRAKLKKSHWVPLIWLAVLAGLFGVSLFMTLQRAQLIWDSVEALAFIQFPWRWLSVASVFGGIMVISSLALVGQRIRWAAAAGLVVILLTLNWQYFQPEEYMEDPDALYYVDPNRIQTHMSDILPDYIPAGMPEEIEPTPELFTLTDPAAGEVEVVIDRGHQTLLQTNLTQPTQLTFSIADFPGWYVEVNGERADKITTEDGLLAVNLPEGQHLVGASFGATPVRTASDMVSLVSVMIMLYLTLPALTQATRGQSAQHPAAQKPTND